MAVRLNEVFEVAQMVLLAGWAVILGAVFTVRMAGLELMAGGTDQFAEREKCSAHW